MKLVIYTLLAIPYLGAYAIQEVSDYHVHLEPMWENLDTRGDYEKQFGNKWILVGSITFRKKANEAVKVEHLTLQWHGEKIDHVCGALYRKIPERKFLAIEENLICDSTWNQAEQKLLFDFHANRQSLGPLTIFYLVLSIPTSVENKLQNGHFSLSHFGLPMQLQEYTKSHQLDLAFNIPKKIAPSARTTSI